MVRPGGDWQKLVFDLGAAEGDDSAHYLRRGYRVISVEALPEAAEELRQRFGTEIADGRLTVVSKGIAERSGQATFWFCEDEPWCSTFDESFMGRWGKRHRPIMVPTVTFRELVEEYGRATYWKIDIEGNDYLCLSDPPLEKLPRYLSIEVLDAVEPTVRRLRELGYDRFKLISQRSFDQPSPVLARAKSRLAVLSS